MRQIIIDFGQIGTFPLRIYGYGLMLVMGFLCAIFLARHRARRFGENPDTVTTLGLLSLLGGVVGARLAFVIEKWNTQFAPQPDPLLDIVNITSGGLIYYGGVLLATLVILGYLVLKRLPVRRYLDILAPALMIGLAFGRMGCFLNGCCYGGPARDDFALAMRFPYATSPLLNFSHSHNIFAGASVSPAFAHQVGTGELTVPAYLLEDAQQACPALVKSPSQLTPAEAQEASGLRSLPLQPAQPLELISALLLAGLLLAFSRLRTREGQVFALVLILYPIVRFIMESIRGDNLHDLLALRLTHNQYSSMLMIVAGVLMWIALRRLPASCGAFALQRQAAGGHSQQRNR